jgi:hypothetical protein
MSTKDSTIRAANALCEYLSEEDRREREAKERGG